MDSGNSDNGCGGRPGFDHHSLQIPLPPPPQHQFHHPTQKKRKITPSFDHLQSINDQHRQSTSFSQHCRSDLIQTQTLQFHHSIHLQNERLRFAMQERINQQTSQLIERYESKVRLVLNQKEEDITKAANRNMELQDYLKRMEIESQTWQRAAKETKTMAASLTTTIQQLRESTSALSSDAARDAESCCQNTQEELEQQKTPMAMICRCCNSRTSCIVILPCRHLCCCKECEMFLESCPRCRMIKKSSIEAWI